MRIASVNCRTMQLQFRSSDFFLRNRSEILVFTLVLYRSELQNHLEKVVAMVQIETFKAQTSTIAEAHLEVNA